MIKAALFLLFFLQLNKAWTQQSCPCFNANVTDGCVPLSIQINDCSNGTNLRYNYQEVPSSGFIAATNYVYNTVGIFSITQRGNFTCGTIDGLDTLPKRNYINVRSVRRPTLKSSPCANHQVQIIANDPQYDQYLVKANGGEVIVPRGQSKVIALDDPLPASLEVQGEYISLCKGTVGTLPIATYTNLFLPKVNSISILNDKQLELSFTAEKYHRYELSIRTGVSGAFQKLDTLDGLEGIIRYPLSNLNTLINNYCIQIKAMDFCGQETQPVEICSVILSGIAQNKQNAISWSDYPSSLLSDYSLTIGGSPSSIFANRAQKATFNDTSVSCGQEYCYQIKTKLANGSSSNSNSICLKAISNAVPPTVQDFQSSVENDKVQLTWTSSPTQPTQYDIYRSANGNTFSPLGTSNTSDYLDLNSDPSNVQLCYRIGYTDNCGNTSVLSPSSCPVLLEGKVITSASRIISWKPYVVWPEGLKENIVERMDENGIVFSSSPVGNASLYSDILIDSVHQIIHFRIRSVSTTGRVSLSNLWKMVQESKVYFPNAFTPNGDGLNDVFFPAGLFVSEFQIEIWNRTGEGMFKANSIKEGWDGKVNGQNVPNDTYMFKWEGKDVTGKAYKTYPGTLQLIR